jgi:hypothetical protein
MISQKREQKAILLIVSKEDRMQNKEGISLVLISFIILNFFYYP